MQTKRIGELTHFDISGLFFGEFVMGIFLYEPPVIGGNKNRTYAHIVGIFHHVSALGWLRFFPLVILRLIVFAHCFAVFSLRTHTVSRRYGL